MWTTPPLVTAGEPRCGGMRDYKGLPLWGSSKNQVEAEILEELLNLSYGMYQGMRDTDKLRSDIFKLCNEVYPNLNRMQTLRQMGVDKFNNTAYSSIVNDVDIAQPFPDSVVHSLSLLSEIMGMCRSMLGGEITYAPYQIALLHISLQKFGAPMSSYATQIKDNFANIKKGFNDEQTIWLDDLLNTILDTASSPEVQQMLIQPMETYFSSD